MLTDPFHSCAFHQPSLPYPRTVSLAEYNLLGDIFLMTLISFFLLALPGYAIVRARWPESDWNLSGSVSTSKIQLLDLVVAGGFAILFALNWKFLGSQIVQSAMKNPSVNSILSGSLGYLMIAAIIPIVLFWRGNLIEFFGLRWSAWKHIFWIVPAFIISMAILGWLLYLLGWNSWVSANYGAKQQQMVELLKNNPDPALLGAIAFSAIIIAPIAEEFIFRGYLYPVVKRYSERWFAALFTGLLFGVVHFNLMGLPLLIIMGVVLVILYEITGSLWVPIACHATFNSLSVASMLLARFSEFPPAP